MRHQVYLQPGYNGEILPTCSCGDWQGDPTPDAQLAAIRCTSYLQDTWRTRTQDSER